MIEFIVGGAIVAFVSMQLSYRAFKARIRQLEESRDSWRKTAETWERSADASHAANLRIQQTNADLLELVERQKQLIAKLAYGNKDVPARDN